MAFDLSSISAEARLRAPRIVLLGVEKIGKSTFASQANSPVFLPIKGEEGIDDLLVPKTPVCASITDALGWLRTLYEGQHAFQTVVIDSGSTLELLIHSDACERLGLKRDGTGETRNIIEAGGGYGTGYKEALVVWQDITNWLDALRSQRDMASILIGHVIVRRFDDPNGDSYDQYQWDINEKAANLLYRWADVILFANTKVIVKQKNAGFGKTKGQGIEVVPGSRFLYTQKRPAHPGGGRGIYGQLPYELPLSWGNYQDAIAARVAQVGVTN